MNDVSDKNIHNSFTDSIFQLLLLCLLLGFAFLIGSFISTLQIYDDNKSIVIPSPTIKVVKTPTPIITKSIKTPTPTQKIDTKTYITRSYTKDISIFENGEKKIVLPEEITTISDDVLLEFSCSDLFNYSKEQKAFEIPNDKEYQKIAHALVSKNQDLNFENIMFCSIKNSLDIFIVYKVQANQGYDYIAFQKIGNDTTTLLSNVDKYPYLNCKDVLHITNDDKLYVRCDSSDAYFSGVIIAKIDFNQNNNDANILLQCTSQGDESNPEDAFKITCK